MPVSGNALDSGLRSLGFAAFRPGQRDAIETLLGRRRLMLVAPTGGGKSLVYQLPAALLDGTTLVVSPLIALMHDQVSALEERGVAATYLASTLDPDELRRRTAEVRRGLYKLVYVAPERLAAPGFQALLRHLDCPLVAVDEAHCVSEWGHDFRPEYRTIGAVLPLLQRARVLACTATATPVVVDDILACLGLPPDTPKLVHGFARPNLVLRAAEFSGRRERDRLVDELLEEAQGAAIVYSPTRREAEAEAARLGAAFYHAGMSGEAREEVQRAFLGGATDVVVATNAFGMGIDRADVRAVIHLAPPGSVEAYYQEVGRAGRDGETAYGLCLTSARDLPRRRHLIESDGGDPAIVEHKWGLFLELMRWIEGGSCRHDAILRYFDAEEGLGPCGRCDCCRSLETGESDPAEVDVTVRKALSAVARVHGRFGLNVAAKLLKGANDERLDWSGLGQTPTFGALDDRAEDWIMRLLRRCVTAGWVVYSGGERPVVRLTDEGRDVMQGKRPARLLLPPARRKAKKAGPRPVPVAEELDAGARALFEDLRAWRLERSRAEEVPPYVVASDRCLRDIAARRPETRAGLMLCHGIGPAKAERYGDGLLEVIARAP